MFAYLLKRKQENNVSNKQQSNVYCMFANKHTYNLVCVFTNKFDFFLITGDNWGENLVGTSKFQEDLCPRRARCMFANKHTYNHCAYKQAVARTFDTGPHYLSWWRASAAAERSKGGFGVVVRNIWRVARRSKHELTRHPIPHFTMRSAVPKEGFAEIAFPV